MFDLTSEPFASHIFLPAHFILTYQLSQYHTRNRINEFMDKSNVKGDNSINLFSLTSWVWGLNPVIAKVNIGCLVTRQFDMMWTLDSCFSATSLAKCIERLKFIIFVFKVIISHKSKVTSTLTKGVILKNSPGNN